MCLHVNKEKIINDGLNFAIFYNFIKILRFPITKVRPFTGNLKISLTDSELKDPIIDVNRSLYNFLSNIKNYISGLYDLYEKFF